MPVTSFPYGGATSEGVAKTAAPAEYNLGLGKGAYVLAEGGIAIGNATGAADGTITDKAAIANASGAVQIGPGTNAVANSIQFRTTVIPTVLKGAGTPTATATVPVYAGQIYMDTAADKVYMCIVLSATPVVGDWTILN